MSTKESLDRRRARAARNQSLCREVNAGIGEQLGVEVARRPFICECADLHCSREIEVTVAEYEQVREAGAVLFVAPDPAHAFPDIQNLVGATDRYWTVRNIGVAAAVANDFDHDSRQRYTDDQLQQLDTTVREGGDLSAGQIQALLDRSETSGEVLDLLGKQLDRLQRQPESTR